MRVKNSILVAVPVVLCVLLSPSCTTIDYQGNTVAPSNKVDVFFALADVGKPFTVMGQMKAHAQAGRVSIEAMQKKMVKAALERGADALVYLSDDTSQVPNHDYAQDFRSADERPAFGPEPSDTVRIIKALLLKYGAPPAAPAE